VTHQAAAMVIFGVWVWWVQHAYRLGVTTVAGARPVAAGG
jgi:hypothetical protein